MSGICDTCSREHLCSLPIGEVLSCSYHKQSRWLELFGTPERAARTMTAARDACKTTQPCYPNCPLGAAPWCPSKSGSGDYDALLEWLRGDAE